MKFTITTFLSLFCSIAFAKIEVKISYSPVTNMIYQLDCISNILSNCSRENYQALWDKFFLKSQNDKDAVKSWGDILAKYSTDVELKNSGSPSGTGRFVGLKPLNKIRIASFQSKEPHGYFDRLDLVMLPTDSAKIEAIFNRFYPRFTKWWEKEAKPKGLTFAKDSEKLLKSRKLTKKLQDFYKFYAVNLATDVPVYFSFFYRPDLADEATRGQQIENYSTTEFLPSESAEERMDVVIHELCHFFWESTDPVKFDQLERFFIQQEGLEVMPAYYLMNEALATAIGNGMINRLYKSEKDWREYFARDMSLYYSYEVDKAAKALLPVVDEWLEKGRSIYHKEFFKKYLAAIKTAFGDELTAPKYQLNKMVLLVDSKHEGEVQPFIRRIPSVKSIWLSRGDWADERFLSSYKRRKNLNALLVVHPDNLSKLRDHKLLPQESFNALKDTYDKNKKAIFAHQRNASALIYIVTAKNEKEVKELIDKLFNQKEGFSGPLSQ